MTATLLAFLDGCHSVQNACDDAVEKCLAAASACSQPTATKLAKGINVLEMPWMPDVNRSLACSSRAAQWTMHAAWLRVSAAPFLIPEDCLRHQPSSAFLILYHHALDCVMQATRIALDPNIAHAPLELRAVWVAACLKLLEVAEGNCVALASAVGDESRHNLYSRSPLLLRAWIRAAFFGDVAEAQKVVESSLPIHSNAVECPRDASTLGDALCLLAMCLLLLGRPAEALPHLSRAAALADTMKNSALGWQCSRGTRTLLWTLLLSGEAKRAIHQRDASLFPEWLDDVRSAARSSADESRQFAGVAIDKDTSWLFVNPAPDEEGSSTRIKILPRLVHRMLHLYAAGIFIAIPGEVHSSADVLDAAPAKATEESGSSRNDSGSNSSARTMMTWYDMVAAARAGYRCAVALPLLTAESASAAEEPTWIANVDPEHPRFADAAAARNTSSERCVEPASTAAGAPDMDSRFVSLLLEFSAKLRGAAQRPSSSPSFGPVRGSTSFAKRMAALTAASADGSGAFAQRVGTAADDATDWDCGRDPHAQAVDPSRRTNGGSGSSSTSNVFAHRKKEPLRGRVVYAFNSSFVQKASSKAESKAPAASPTPPPQPNEENRKNDAPAKLFRSLSVFERLSGVPLSARGTRPTTSHQVDDSTVTPARRPLSARTRSSSSLRNPDGASREDSAAAHSSRRRESAPTAIRLPHNAEESFSSRLANAVRGKVNSAR